MKVENIDNNIIVYLRKNVLKNLDFNNLEMLENYFRELVIKMKNIYNIKIEGFYNIKVYIDNIYGAIIDIEPENIDYCLVNEIEMRISLFHEKFLYEIDDLYQIPNTKIIKNGLKYYLNVNNNIEYKNYLEVLENSKIIYKNTENIIKYGIDITYLNLNKSVI